MSSLPAASASSSSSSSSTQLTNQNGASYFPLPFHLQQQLATPYAATTAPQPAAVYAYPAPVPTPIAGVYSLPQYQQALFQKDAQAITPEAIESVKAALASSEIEHKGEAKKKAIPRKAAGQAWEDPTLTEWPENDYRVFCGDLGNEVNDDVLTKAFSRFPSFNNARSAGGVTENVNIFTQNRWSGTGVLVKTKGYGFVSFGSPSDLAAALKEMNGKYVGNRPIKLRKSNWKERTDYEALERQKKHTQKKAKFQKKTIFHK